MMNDFNKLATSFVKTHNNSNFEKAHPSFVNALKEENNWGYTANGAVGKKSTGSKLYDLFAMGGAYRQRSEADCVLLFKEAYIENPEYALKCLWYLRDIISGQGERRFFRVCLRWLASYDKKAVLRNIETIARDGFGRFDDLYCLFDTPCEEAALNIFKTQLAADMKALNAKSNAAVSLCAKWAASINCSSSTSKQYGRKIAAYLGVNQRTYRKMLSALRERIKVVERLMSQNRWEEIDFSKLPSRAGLIYRNAFKNKGLIAEKYREFAKNENTVVNAAALYPYDVARKAIEVMHSDSYWNRSSVALDDTERLMVNKYWNNLKNYFEGAISNLMVVADSSGSMTGGRGSVRPIDVATSLAVYAAEHAKGPFANHYISFSRRARLVETVGVDFCDKIDRIVRANLCEDTNLESVLDLVLNTAMNYHLSPSDVPSTLVVITDMQVNVASNSRDKTTFMESMRRKWYQKCGGKYEFPSLVLWNVNAAVSNTNIIDDSKTGVTFVSGCSPTIFKQVLTGVTGETLMYQTLDSERYRNIH